MRLLPTLDDVAAAVGEELGPSEWLLIDQERISSFASATGDDQWIHVDPARAPNGPFSTTVAHGYLTLSLIPMLGAQIVSFGRSVTRLNYGTNKVRFPSPVPVGSWVRARATILEVASVSAGSQVTTRYTIELQGANKPACVAETVVLLVPVEGSGGR